MHLDLVRIVQKRNWGIKTYRTQEFKNIFLVEEGIGAGTDIDIY